MCIIDCLSTIVFILPLHLDYTKVIILILWWRNFQLEYWRTFQLVSTIYTSKLEVEPKACFNGTCNTIKEAKQIQTEAMEKAPKSDQAMKK